MKKSNQRIFKVASIGSVASNILSKDQTAQVFGNTSRGIFIKTSGRWLVFLSFEKFRGPLTLTLTESDPIFRNVTSEESVRIATQSIFLPALDLAITTEDSQVWQPMPPSARHLGNAERQEVLVEFAKEIISKTNGVGLSSLIPPLLGIPAAHRPPEREHHFGWDDLRQVQKYIRNREAIPLAVLLATLMGSGPGLTPSADDFVAGLLLALNRWHNLLWSADKLRDLNQQVVETAYKKTTTLSANLIECAALGLADERLVNTLDWLITGSPRNTDILADLLGWGNSSGVDTFVGMAATIIGSV